MFRGNTSFFIPPTTANPRKLHENMAEELSSAIVDAASILERRQKSSKEYAYLETYLHGKFDLCYEGDGQKQTRLRFDGIIPALNHLTRMGFTHREKEIEDLDHELKPKGRSRRIYFSRTTDFKNLSKDG